MGVPLFQETSIYTLYTEHIIVTYMHTIGIKKGLEIWMVDLGRSKKNIAKDWAPNGPLKICCITRASSWYLLIKSAAGHIQRTNDTYTMCWTDGSDSRLLHKARRILLHFPFPDPFPWMTSFSNAALSSCLFCMSILSTLFFYANPPHFAASLGGRKYFPKTIVVHKVSVEKQLLL